MLVRCHAETLKSGHAVVLTGRGPVQVPWFLLEAVLASFHITYVLCRHSVVVMLA